MTPVETGGGDGGNTGKKPGKLSRKSARSTWTKGGRSGAAVAPSATCSKPDRQPQGIVSHPGGLQFNPEITAKQILKYAESVAVGSGRMQQDNRNDQRSRSLLRRWRRSAFVLTASCHSSERYQGFVKDERFFGGSRVLPAGHGLSKRTKHRLYFLGLRRIRGQSEKGVEMLHGFVAPLEGVISKSRIVMRIGMVGVEFDRLLEVGC